MIDLGRAEDSGSVRDKLALALGDPALQIAFIGPDAALVDEGGRPVRLLAAGPGRVRTTLRNNGQDIAASCMTSVPSTIPCCATR